MNSDQRLRLAVFIDFDNIEIGVKNTLNASFDAGIVLEALKERGDVVSKTAYSDWQRAGGHSRMLTQHAIKMVQRNLTPGGDKNGADINLALDALEMAFTHPHINAYVIVGGDSDFISLVEKLKQYDKQIFVVGGRAFTSVVMQRNCHEFVAYENLLGSRRGSSDRGRPAAAAAQTSIEQVVPLVRRALKVLTDREVSPQLGLLKSTLLQLDSTFSERTYGVSSFRDFAQKLAAAGHVTVKEAGRNVLVELTENAPTPSQEEARPPRQDEAPRSQEQPRRDDRQPQQGGPSGEVRAADAVREVRRLFQSAQNPPRWPMYIRQAKQFMRNVDSSFDERKFGFPSLVDLLRACQREGLFRMERDRQGVIRLFPGNVMQSVDDMPTPAQPSTPGAPRPWQPGDDIPDIHEKDRLDEPVAAPPAAAAAEVVEGDVVQEMETPPVLAGEQAPEPAGGEESPRQGRGRARKTAGEKPARAAKQPRAAKEAKPKAAAKPRARKKTAAAAE